MAKKKKNTRSFPTVAGRKTCLCGSFHLWQSLCCNARRHTSCQRCAALCASGGVRRTSTKSDQKCENCEVTNAIYRCARKREREREMDWKSSKYNMVGGYSNYFLLLIEVKKKIFSIWVSGLCCSNHPTPQWLSIIIAADWNQNPIESLSFCLFVCLFFSPCAFTSRWSVAHTPPKMTAALTAVAHKVHARSCKHQTAWTKTRPAATTKKREKKKNRVQGFAPQSRNHLLQKTIWGSNSAARLRSRVCSTANRPVGRLSHSRQASYCCVSFVFPLLSVPASLLHELPSAQLRAKTLAQANKRKRNEFKSQWRPFKKKKRRTEGPNEHSCVRELFGQRRSSLL